MVAARVVAAIREMVPKLGEMPFVVWKEMLAQKLGRGCPRLIGEDLLPFVREELRMWGHPWAFVGLAEWLRVCCVQGAYGERKVRRRAEVEKMVAELPSELRQTLSVPEILGLFAGSLLMRESVRSPATVSTYVGEASAALGGSKKSRVVSDTLAGVNRLWLHRAQKAPPVPPQQVKKAVHALGSLEARVCARLWMVNGARQGCLEHLLFEPTQLELREDQKEAVLVARLSLRKGVLTWQGPRPELLLVGPCSVIRSCFHTLRGLLSKPLGHRNAIFEELVRWRKEAGWRAHGIRRGTSAWMSQQQVPLSNIAAALGHAEEVKKFGVTQSYTEGRDWAARLQIARALPPM